MPNVRACPSWADEDDTPQRPLTRNADGAVNGTVDGDAPLSPILENSREKSISMASQHSNMLGSDSSDDSDTPFNPKTDAAPPEAPPPPAAAPKKPYLGKADQSAFVRRSNKYWVRNGDVPILKAFIGTYIKKARDGLIQSVYLDGDDFPLYNSRLQAEEGSTLVRLRWYGDKFPPKDLYVERKIHHECHLTTALSMKERFVIPARELGDLLNYRLNDLTIKKADGDGNLPDEIVRKLKESKSKPKLRTEYFRTAWEDADIPEYRISLDEHVSYFKDEDFGAMRNDSGWECLRKTGNAGYWAFPFSILEVKVDMAAAMQGKMAKMGAEDGPMPGYSTKEIGLAEEAWEPDWVTMAKERNLIMTTCKYSKFLSATAWIYGGCGGMSDSPHLSHLPEYMPILQEATQNNQIDGMLPSVTGMKLTNKSMVKRNLTVEPKTWMATERTFIKWLQLAAMIFLIPIVMDKFEAEDVADSNHRGHKVATYIMLIVGIFVTCYAFVVYVYRLDLLKNKKVGKWYDIKGTFLVVFTLLLAHLLILADKIIDDT